MCIFIAHLVETFKYPKQLQQTGPFAREAAITFTAPTTATVHDMDFTPVPAESTTWQRLSTHKRRESQVGISFNSLVRNSSWKRQSLKTTKEKMK